jgi:hypothetical protein
MPTYPAGVSGELPSEERECRSHSPKPTPGCGRSMRPREAGQYLRFDAARPIDAASDLLVCLESVF